MQESNKQIYADFSAEGPILSWAHPNGCDNACQPMIRWPFQLFVHYHLSQEALSHVKTPSSHCYLTHGGVQPLGPRWYSGILSLTLLFCGFLFTLQWLQLMLKNDVCLVLLTLSWLQIFSLRLVEMIADQSLCGSSSSESLNLGPKGFITLLTIWGLQGWIGIR